MKKYCRYIIIDIVVTMRMKRHCYYICFASSSFTQERDRSWTHTKNWLYL